MLKPLTLIIGFFVLVCNTYAQEYAVSYPKPFRYEKAGNSLMVDATIYFQGNVQGLAIDLDGVNIPYTAEGDSLRVKLPFIGNKGILTLRKNDQVLGRQEFDPYIPADWRYFKSGTIDIVNTSHQDIAWMNTPDSCREDRIDKIIIPALKIAGDNPGFCFGMEQTLNLRELLDAVPAFENRVQQAYANHSFSWGATFNQPYEGLETSEQLVRELYLGRKWIHTRFDGKVDTRTAFNMDVPGRTAQFPQILSKAGVRYLVVSRMKEGFFNWYSPDGSRVLTYSPGNYGWASMFYKYFDEDAPTAMHKLASVLANYDTYYSSRHIPPHFAVIISNDAAGPIYYEKVVNEWNRIASLAGNTIPTLRYVTAEDFLRSVDQPGAEFDSIGGERPDLWLYIHGPAHYEAIRAKRDAGIQLRSAEIFSAIDGLLENKMDRYPQQALDSAWYKSIYDDHGWGGKHGDITDSIFGAYHHQADHAGKELLADALHSISEKVKTTRSDALIVFNDLSWDRPGSIRITVPASSGYRSAVDEAGKPLPAQTVSKGDSTILTIHAGNVPSVGYTTVYLDKQPYRNPANHTAGDNFCENNYYQISFDRGGIKSLYDKELQKNILNTTRFAGGDVMDLGYQGNGAGEFTEITPTDMSHFDKLSNHDASWKLTEDGPLYSAYESTSALNGVKIIQRIMVFHLEKKITFQYDIPDWPGVKNRQLRFALPLAADSADISYDLPMGVSFVGKSELNMRPGGWAWGGTYRQDPADIHPREVQNFVSANSKTFGLTMSSNISVFDWIDPTVDAVTYPVIQAIMLSSHKSCHGEGNWYLQQGAHIFSFSITSHAPGWKNGYTFGIANNHPLQGMLKKNKSPKNALPQSLSFISTSSPFVQLTALKKAEDGNDLVARIADMSGADSTVTLKFFRPFKSVQEVNLIEEEPKPAGWQGNNEINTALGHHAIETYKITF